MERVKQNQLGKSVFAGVLIFIFCGWFACMQAKADSSTITVPISGTYAQTDARSMFQMLNTFRTSSGVWCWDRNGNKDTESYKNLSPLVYSYELEKVAMQRAVEISVSFSHGRPCKAQSSGLVCGENIAAGVTKPQSAFDLWEEEDKNYAGQGHRRNMLTSYFKSVGIASFTRNGTTYWVQEFGMTTNTGTATAANDSDASFQMELYKSYIISADAMTVDGDGEIPVALGEDKAIPAMLLGIGVERAWPTVGAEIWIPYSFNWTVTDPSVASVSGGVIKGLKVGETTMISSYEGHQVSMDIYVKKPTLTSLENSENIITLTKAPKGVKAKAKKGKVTVSWKKITKNKKGKKLLKNIKKIQVQYSTDPSFTSNKVNKLVGKKKQKVVLKLKRKTTYYIRVRYIGSDGTSGWSKAKKVRTK